MLPLNPFLVVFLIVAAIVGVTILAVMSFILISVMRFLRKAFT